MKFRYYIRGFGAGLIVAAAVLLIAGKRFIPFRVATSMVCSPVSAISVIKFWESELLSFGSYIPCWSPP